MTTDYMDELDALTNPEMVKKAEELASRSSFRPDFTSALVDIANQPVIPYETTLENGTEVRRVSLHLTNMRNIKSVDGKVFPDEEFDLELGLPKRASSNAEIALMVKSAGKIDPKINSIRHFPGLKNVLLVERTHKYQARRPKVNDLGEVEKDDKGKDVWEPFTLTTFYYSVEGIGSAKKVEVAETYTEESQAGALELIPEGDDGMKESDFKAAVIRNATLRKDTALVKAVNSGSFVADMVAKGLLLSDSETIFKVSQS